MAVYGIAVDYVDARATLRSNGGLRVGDAKLQATAGVSQERLPAMP
ncbi:hypothetical protein ANMWB30_40300 [Arthrobacter sp. MWB30]|nr:hypothetical protein ANMWB30_40300 [Arthrobacter sp. MWB30]